MINKFEYIILKQYLFGKKTNFTNLSENSVIASIWSFGDGYQSSFDMNPTCQFSSSGVFNSTLVSDSAPSSPLIYNFNLSALPLTVPLNTTAK